MRILGIETSCDDTGLAIIENDKIIFNKVIKQNHEKGVIPEFAARKHHIALKNSLKKYINKVDLIAYTNGPGLIGSLFVGSSFAKGLGLGMNKPILAINHLIAHCLLPIWMYKVQLPALCLLISGGHSMIILISSLLEYKVISKTVDDALGEAFDKIARWMGLMYPGGPEIEKLALLSTNKYTFKFPVIMKNNINFSFSGLKTAAMNMINKDDSIEKKADFCMQFQEYIAKILVEKFRKINQEEKIDTLIISGGVSANKVIRSYLEEQLSDIKIIILPIKYCTDNGLMIAASAQLLYPIIGATDYNLIPESNCMFKIFKNC